MKQVYCYLFIFFNTFLFAQQTDYVDFKTGIADLLIDPAERKVTGKIEYNFDVLTAVDSIFINSRSLGIKSLFLNGKGIPFYSHKDKLWILNSFKKSKNNILKIEYEASPKKAMYFVGWDNASPNQVWTQGQGKYTSNWLPSFDDINEKIEFDLKIQFEKGYQVIANGRLTDLQRLDHSDYFVWEYDMNKPMSSYLLALVIGKYNKKIENSKSGVPIEMYYYLEDSTKIEPTYRYTKQMFDFLEAEIGVEYPWQNYKIIPVHDFLYAGMENTGTTIFSDGFMIDEMGFPDRNFVNVNAHELAHQWFGDLVTAESGEHHWLQEGFATYYALLAEQEVFGTDYYYWKLFEYANELENQNKAGKSTSLLNPKSSSITFYKKGAWVLHVLREKVGEKEFKKAVKRYLINNRFDSANTNDFLNEFKKLSEVDLSLFIKEWIQEKSFKMEQAQKYLVKNDFGKTLIKIHNLTDKESVLSETKRVIESNSYYPLLHYLFEKLNVLEPSEKHDLFQQVLETKDIKKRQSVAIHLKDIPLELKKNYETLLDDKSYVTVEAALFNLWNSFPQDQEIYLNKTVDMIGFSDKNVRTLWLTLAILTDNDSLGDPEIFLDELISYTSPDYNFEARQNAFKYLRWIRSCEEKCMKNLEEASNHHNWRFKQFAKQLLEIY